MGAKLLHVGAISTGGRGLRSVALCGCGPIRRRQTQGRPGDRGWRGPRGARPIQCRLRWVASDRTPSFVAAGLRSRSRARARRCLARVGAVAHARVDRGTRGSSGPPRGLRWPRAGVCGPRMARWAPAFTPSLPTRILGSTFHPSASAIPAPKTPCAIRRELS
jgi:hypothetical protein